MMELNVVEYKPSKNLSAFVEWYWEGSFNIRAANRISHLVIPNGYIELIIHLSDLHCDLFDTQSWSQSPDYTIIGLFSKPYEVQFGSHVKVFGIRFKPEGIYNLFGIPASKFVGSYEDMTLVLGREFREFCERLKEKQSTRNRIHHTEQYLFNSALRNKIQITYVNRAAELIRKTNGALRIEELSDKVCISLRQLEREFKDKVGMTPKQYLRISRMNEVQRILETNHSLSFTEIAHQSGYADQAHFIRDFKRIIGEKPTIFVRDRDQYIVNTKLAEQL